MEKKRIYTFGNGHAEGKADMRNLLGGKGANLAEMNLIGVPVPPGFTITTEVCNEYFEKGKDDVVALLKNDVEKSIAGVEELMKSKFGDVENPLLVSVRSGARASMPGMMDTILNLGLNDKVVVGLAKKTGNERFAWDSYRRFIQMYGDVVLGMKPTNKEDIDPFEAIIEDVKKAKGVRLDNELGVAELQELVVRFKAAVKAQTGQDFPENAYEQLWGAICAVFDSWMNERAILYRKMEGIPAEWGTAVNVQAMVFGNMGDTSATGVCFSRDAATGEDLFNGEYLINAQGEDVVAGVRTPQPITKLAEDLPDCYKQFMDIAHTLEEHYRDMQDMEFTIQEGKLYFLQTRNGKRTAPAALRIACELVDEGKITKEEAVSRIDAKALDQLLHPNFDQAALKAALPIGEALPASPGAAAGKVYFDAEMAKLHHEAGLKVILVRLETSPEDIEGMHAAEGILTARGGMTSHAAVVARGMGTACVAGCGDIKFAEDGKSFTLGGKTVQEGDYISLDGSTGKIYLGEIRTVPASISGNFDRIMTWADEIRTLQVRTNADTPADALNAVKFGAQGIGLCRTEHMFFDAERIPKIRRMILSTTKEAREIALNQLIPYQKKDFKDLYEVMEGRPVTIRFLDPPLHEFLPNTMEEITALAKDMGVTVEEINMRRAALHEFNPMMGHRGCRLAVTYPEIAKMQTRAVMEAAIEVKQEKGYDIVPEIMIPLVGEKKELAYVKEVVVQTAEKVKAYYESDIKYKVGTMIEIPRAALLADEIAEEAEFFSFGTNDLTQMTFGFSRDDAGKFLESYYENKIYESDPFAKLDQKGVGQLIEMAAKKGKATRPDIHLGICGEHGGDPSSVEFCYRAGLDYVSCSPFRVPIARLAAAQAVLKDK